MSGEKGVWVARKGAERKASGAGMKGVGVVGGGGGAGDNSSCIRMYMYTAFCSPASLFFKSVTHVHGPVAECTRCSLPCGSKRASGLFSLVSTNFVHVVCVKF